MCRPAEGPSHSLASRVPANQRHLAGRSGTKWTAAASQVTLRAFRTRFGPKTALKTHTNS